MATSPEEQIRAWADSMMESTATEPVNAADVIDRAVRRGRRVAPRRPLATLVAAASVVLVVGVVAGINAMAGGGNDVRVVPNQPADGSGVGRPEDPNPPTSGLASTSPVGGIGFVVLGRNDDTQLEPGTLLAATSADEISRVLYQSGDDGVGGSLDPVFDWYVIVSITIPDDACPPELTGFTRDGNTVEPVFVEPPGLCNRPLVPRTYVASLDLETTGASFVLRLPDSWRGVLDEQTLPVDVAPVRADSISFDGVDDVAIGDVVSARQIADEYAPCGFWSGDAGLEGLAELGPDGSWRLTDVRTSSFANRTPSNLGPGSTLAALQRVYGDRLVVDSPDADRTPTSGLVASYNTVAAVRNGDRAITYILDGRDIVQRVKVSAADSWGDDEGCA